MAKAHALEGEQVATRTDSLTDCKWQQSLKIRVETPCEGIEQEARGFDPKDLGTRIKGDGGLQPHLSGLFLKSFEWKLSDDKRFD